MGTYIDETEKGRKHPITWKGSFAHHIIDTDKVKDIITLLVDRHEVRAYERMADEVHCTWSYTCRGANRDDVARVLRRWLGNDGVTDDILKMRPGVIFITPRGKGTRLCRCEKVSEPCEDTAYEW